MFFVKRFLTLKVKLIYSIFIAIPQLTKRMNSRGFVFNSLHNMPFYKRNSVKVTKERKNLLQLPYLQRMSERPENSVQYQRVHQALSELCPRKAELNHRKIVFATDLWFFIFWGSKLEMHFAKLHSLSYFSSFSVSLKNSGVFCPY